MTKSNRFALAVWLVMTGIFFADATDGYKCTNGGSFTSIFYGTFTCEPKSKPKPEPLKPGNPGEF